VSGVETYVLADGAANTLTLVSANFTGLAHHTITVEGGDSGNTLDESEVSASNAAILIGGAGDDTLIAGQHAIMTDGGADLFEFKTTGSTASPDHKTITDSAEGADKIVFSYFGFRLKLPDASATAKLLRAGLFAANATGGFGTAAQRFAYDTTNGRLYYDAQGNQAGSSRLLVASLTGHPDLTAGQVFFVT
jgi:hypothetical protein